MKVELEHNLAYDRALTCAEKLFEELTEKFKDEFSDLEQTKSGNTIIFSLKVRGMKISGKITVSENKVVIESKLPFAARVFQGLIENKIRENADKEIAKCQ
jgi:hypothetical protein